MYSHLTDRDRLLLARLDEHRVLTNSQIRQIGIAAGEGEPVLGKRAESD
jgi:hypothetical protein